MRFVAVLLVGLFYVLPLNSLEVGLKISSEKNWTTWGDHILGQDLKKGFENLGANVKTYYIGNFYGDDKSDIDVYMHGFVPFNPPKKKR